MSVKSRLNKLEQHRSHGAHVIIRKEGETHEEAYKRYNKEKYITNPITNYAILDEKQLGLG